MTRVLSVGLTGGIASGKSAVSRRMSEHGAMVIDADVLARRVLEPGTEGLAEVTASFGEDLLDDDGALDRTALGRLVFQDSEARERLNAIVHPRVRAEAARLRDSAANGSIVVEDIPLLIETGQQDRFDLVVVVQAPYEERLRRMAQDRGMTREDAESRIRAQASDEERATAADVLINNAGTTADLHRRVDELMVNLNTRVSTGE